MNVAVIGCGRIADHAHFPVLNKMEQVRILYACDLIESKALACKEKYPKIENVLTDYHVALADERVEAVFVLTPNAAHYTVTMDALRAGKHVFCEKPIAPDYGKAEEMAKAAKASGLLLNIGVCNRYQESVKRLEKMNREGYFGKIYHVVCSFRSCRSIPGLGGDFTTRAVSGGGVLIDWGVHFLDLILYVLGGAHAKTVSCDTYCEMAKDMGKYRYRSMWAEDTKDTVHGTNDVEDFVAAHIRTDKATITLNGAWAQNLGEEEMYVDFLGDRAGARLFYGKGIETFDGTTLQREKPEYEIPNQYECEDRAFLEAVRTGEHTCTYVDRILPSARMMEAMYRSAAAHHEVEADA